MERTRKPTSPGEIIKAHYLEPLNLSIAELAQSLGVSSATLSSVINGRKSVDVDMAIRLSQALSTTPELWLNLQSALDLWEARQNFSKWATIKPLPQLVEYAQG